MTDTQAVEGQPATPPEGQPVAAAVPEGSPEAPPTAGQVEAEYKARLSGKDKAHAAEVATFDAAAPTAWAVRIERPIHQLQRTAATVGPLRPLT